MDETQFRWRVAAPGGWWREPKGRDAMTSHPHSDRVACMQGDGHRGISHAGFGISAIGDRLRDRVGSGPRHVMVCVGGVNPFQVSGLGRRVSGSAVQVQVQDPGLTPEPEDLNLGPEARDPTPEKDVSVVFSPPESRPSRRLRSVRTRLWTTRRSRPRRCARGPGP